MATAIHFPQPVSPEEATVVPMLDRARRSWIPNRKQVVVGLVTATCLSLAWVTPQLMNTPDEVPVAAAGSAEIAIRQMLGGSGDRYVAGASVVAARKNGERWVVTVAADLLALTESGYIPAGFHYFEVHVAEHDGAWMILDGPAEVGGSPIRQDNSAELRPPPKAPATNAIQIYLNWLLTGAAGSYDAERPVPPPYRSVTITGMETHANRDGEEAQVTVAAVDEFGHVLELSYQLQLLNEQGSWVVIPGR